MVVSGASEGLGTSFGGVAKKAATIGADGGIVIHKAVNDGPYYGPGGAVFEVFNSSDVLVDTVTTNTIGIARTTLNLPTDATGVSYDVKEVTAPSGYSTQPDQSVTVFPTAYATVDFTGIHQDLIIPAHLGAEKIDAQTGNPLAGATFAFAYDPTNNGDFTESLGSCTTTGSGICQPPTENTTGGWRAGEYRITETASPPGYWLDPTTAVQTVTIAPGATATASVTFADFALGSLQLKKTGNDTAYWSVAGAVFHVTGPSPSTAAVGTLTVGTTGITNTLTTLAPGSYKLTETPPPGYSAVTPITVVVTKGHATTEVTVTDPVQPGSITVTKTDAETHDPLAGATFDFRYDATDDGTYNVDLGSCTTGAAGTCSPPTNDGTGYLPGNYEAIETAAPPGYYLPTPAPVARFTLTPGGTATPTVSDQLLVPAEFIKSATGNVNTSMEDLAGAVIDITAGTTYGGTPVATCTTSAKGTCTTGSTLISGDPYCWAETQAPPGLAIGAGGCFTATNDQGATPIGVSDPGEFTPVRIKKVDAVDPADTLSGATFDLYRVDTATDGPGPRPPHLTSPHPRNWADVGRPGDDRRDRGRHIRICSTPATRYCALEVTAPANFAPTSKEHCTTGPTSPSTSTPPPTTTITVADTPVMVTLRAHKFAAEAPDTVIPGAVYDLYVVGTLPPGGATAQTPTTPAPTPEAGDTWYARGTTNATGDLAWKVPAGYSWCLHEVTAPGEYVPETGLYCTSELTATTPAPQTTVALPETVALVTITGRKYNATDPTEVIPGATYEAVGVGTPPPGYAPAPNPQGYPVPTGDWFYGTATTNATGLVTFTVPAGESWCLHEVVVPADYQRDSGFHCTPVLMRDPPTSATTLALPETPTGYQIIAGGGREPSGPAGPAPLGLLLLFGGLGITAGGASWPWLSGRRLRRRGNRP